MAIGIALAVPLAGIGPAIQVAPAAAGTPTVPQAAMVGRGEASAPAQKLGSGKMPPAPAPKNTVKPPSLRSMFPVNEAKPVDPSAAQPAPKDVAALPLPPSAVKGFDAKTSREVTEKRDRFTQTFANADTSETTVISPAPLNFKKADGTWADIDPNLQPADPGGWEAISTELYSWIAPKADADPVARIELGEGHDVGWGVSGATGVAGQMSGNKVLFADFMAGADLELESQPRGIKETIVLKSAAAARSHVFPLSLSSNLTAALVGREVVLTDEHGVERARIPAGTMEDSNAVDGHATSEAVTYELVTVAGRPALKVTADSAWLDDPSRVFPVRIDPTVIPTDRITPNYAVSAGVNGSISGADNLQIGCRPASGNTCSGSGWDAFTSLLYFPNLVDAFRYDTITAAQLEVYNYQADTCSSRAVEVYGAMAGWSGTPLPQLKYPGPALTPSVIAANSFSRGYVSNASGTTTCEPRYDALEFNGAGIGWLQSLVDGKRSNFGFAMLANKRTDRYSWKKFAGINTANPPKLAVTHSPFHAEYLFRKQNPADYVLQVSAIS